MKKIEKVNVFLEIENKILIGQLVENNNQIYFKYNDNYLNFGFNISPFKLKFDNSIQQCYEKYLEGLFGVFSDSLPDGWGKFLQDRKLIENGILPLNFSVLNRLCLLNKNGAGALSYEPNFEEKASNNSFNLDQLSTEIEHLIKNNSKIIIDEILTFGGSSGGARPKLYVGYNETNDELIYGTELLPEGFEHWIIKFPNSNDLQDIAKIEFVYNEMAKIAGIMVNEFKLFKNTKNQFFFGAKRFDRNQNKKLHLHSVSGLLHDNFRLSTLDYGHIMNAAYELENNFSVYEKVLRLAIFNVLAHNRDDHSKNFSFIMDQFGKWNFAPAYDLTFSNSSNHHHSTSVASEYAKPGKKQLQELANHFGISNFNIIYNEVQYAVSQFSVLANEIGINKNVIQMINKKSTNNSIKKMLP